MKSEFCPLATTGTNCENARVVSTKLQKKSHPRNGKVTNHIIEMSIDTDPSDDRNFYAAITTAFSIDPGMV